MRESWVCSSVPIKVIHKFQKDNLLELNCYGRLLSQYSRQSAFSQEMSDPAVLVRFSTSLGEKGKEKKKKILFIC